MDQLLGLLLLAFYIITVVGLAALITYAVIRIFPTQRTPKKPDTPDKPQPTSGDGVVGESGAGRLFRRAKRGTA